MEFKAETFTATNGASVEVGTVNVDGREFQATGSIIDREQGIVVGYVRETKLPPRDPSIAGSTARTVYDFGTWGGSHIAPLFKTGESFGFYGSKITHFGMLYDGHRWHGKIGLDWNQRLVMRRGRKVS